ncbi:antiviral reverse transcriptase Drt3a [Enterobacter cloacae]|nr:MULTISPECIES: antiviral reverse transcriptase Drt3a [Enterobacter cloacae complex]EKT9190945.1 RNA-directed DNA polymerase [Enterobacter cloacae]EKU3859149.1 RNA-directed DNA polymerase [Enterobacter cloacae]EKX9063642.1 RNA-directed DNA polymerase [Enterobacter cloacae]ELR9204499.1 RNA-directed DNA polymerase [Enterobacter cloacae]MBG0523379.1 RNA-directed DNA polymerase [Enterobacter cloacae]
MLDQRINPQVFLRMTSLKDIIRYKLGRNKEEYLSSFKEAIDLINSKSHNFDDIFSYDIKGKTIFKVQTIASLYYSRYINKTLKRLYKVKQSNRDIITQQINALLTETSPFYIIKGDVKDFYESINCDRVIRKLKEDKLLDLRHIAVIEQVLGNSKGSIGIPRGISFCSTLGELFVRKFDEEIRRMPGVYFYARYVDDFVIFTHDDEINISHIEKELSKLGLCLNKNKTHKYSSALLYKNKQCITFLGYMHEIHSKNNVLIKISNKRIKKIKTRIILTYLDFFKNKDIELFELRIQFLTGNYIINTTQDNKKNLLAGFYYNNSAINDHSQISELDRFLMRIATSNKGFIPSGLSSGTLAKLKSIPRKHYFAKGFHSRVVHEIDVEDFNKIKSCWDREYIYEKSK